MLGDCQRSLVALLPSHMAGHHKDLLTNCRPDHLTAHAGFKAGILEQLHTFEDLHASWHYI